MELPDDVRQAIQRLNELFHSQRTLSSKLEAVTEMVQAIVPGCDSASISLTVEEAMFTGASSSQLAIEADLVQYRVDEGPCLDAADERAVVRIDALIDDERFEHFAPGAIELGVESTLSIPLVAGEQPVGSLNLYSRTPGSFTDADPGRITSHVAYAAQLIATSPFYAASAETLARIIEADQQATQVAIALGMLMFVNGLRPSEAWDHLLVLGARDETTIIETSRRLIDEHERGLGHPDQPREGG